jgi:hypothetical protein
LAALALLASPLVGCGNDGGGETSSGTSSNPPSGCKLGFLGDASAPVDMRVVALTAGGQLVDLVEGGTIDMILPPQGGRVVFVGAVLTNIEACYVELSGAMRDNVTNQVRVDQRTTNLSPIDGGFGGPVAADISTFSNIPLCPNQWASSAVYGTSFELTVSVIDRDGRSASQSLQVTPSCAEPMFEAECSCQCQQDYMLGEACP